MPRVTLKEKKMRLKVRMMMRIHQGMPQTPKTASSPDCSLSGGCSKSGAVVTITAAVAAIENQQF